MELSSSHIAGSALTNSTISSQTGPAVTTTSATKATNTPAKTASEAGPRFQPRRTRLPTTGSRPKARTAASRIEISVPSESSASATTAPNASSMSSVRKETLTCTSGVGLSIRRRYGAGG